MSATTDAVDQKHSTVHEDPHDVSLSTMQCPADGTQLSDTDRDDGRVECPHCRTRWQPSQVVVSDG
jgi:hypothetical protein